MKPNRQADKLWYGQSPNCGTQCHTRPHFTFSLCNMCLNTNLRAYSLQSVILWLKIFLTLPKLLTNSLHIKAHVNLWHVMENLFKWKYHTLTHAVNMQDIINPIWKKNPKIKVLMSPRQNCLKINILHWQYNTIPIKFVFNNTEFSVSLADVSSPYLFGFQGLFIHCLSGCNRAFRKVLFSVAVNAI